MGTCESKAAGEVTRPVPSASLLARPHRTKLGGTHLTESPREGVTQLHVVSDALRRMESLIETAIAVTVLEIRIAIRPAGPTTSSRRPLLACGVDRVVTADERPDRHLQVVDVTCRHSAVAAMKSLRVNQFGLPGSAPNLTW